MDTDEGVLSPQSRCHWRRREDAGAAREAMCQGLGMHTAQFEGYTTELGRMFPFQGFIALTEERGITLPQLRRVLDFGRGRESDWRAAQCGSAGLAGDAAFNLYHVNAWLIKPATHEPAPEVPHCAFVELLAQQPQPPCWFCSHWWGEPVEDFVACVDKHQRIRGHESEGEENSYWVCAYANRQHGLDEEISADLVSTSFFRALKRCVGVLLILDTKATPFSRIWCVYEECVALGVLPGVVSKFDAPMLLDIATTTQSGAQLFTDGLTKAEQAYKPWEQIKSQLTRQADFPFAVLRHGLCPNLHSAQASMESDRRTILNAIIGMPANNEPPATHERYDMVNRRLGGVFARAGWVHAIKEGRARELGFGEALRADVWCKELKLKFGPVDPTDEDLRTLASGLPSSVLDLHLDFGGCERVSDAGLCALTQSLPRGLINLHLLLWRCSISDETLCNLGLHLPSTLKQVVVSVNECKNVSDSGVRALVDGLPSGLEDFLLYFKNCEQCTDDGLHHLASRLPESLKSLKLDMRFSGVTEEGRSAGCRFKGGTLEKLRAWEQSRRPAAA